MSSGYTFLLNKIRIIILNISELNIHHRNTIFTKIFSIKIDYLIKWSCWLHRHLQYPMRYRHISNIWKYSCLWLMITGNVVRSSFKCTRDSLCYKGLLPWGTRLGILVKEQTQKLNDSVLCKCYYRPHPTGMHSCCSVFFNSFGFKSRLNCNIPTGPTRGR